MRQSGTYAVLKVVRRAAGALTILLCLTASTGVMAQSLYACRSLNSAIPPSFEGLDGVFFRIDPNLLSYQRIHPDVVSQIAKLSRALAARGTRLVFVPVPTKALTVPDRLGPEADRRAYDPAIAAALFDDTVQRLRDAGILTVQTRSALGTRRSDAMSYFAADPRLSSKGLERLAQAIAQELPTLRAEKVRPDVSHLPPQKIASPDSLRLQTRCLLPLPEVRNAGRRMGKLAGKPYDPFTAKEAPVAIVGTRLTGTPELDFAAFLSEATGHAVLHRADEGEDPWAAITNYLVSDEFDAHRPEVLIWEVPIWKNLGRRGLEPFQSLMTAVAGTCGPDRIAVSRPEGDVMIELPDASQTGQDMLRISFAQPVERVFATVNPGASRASSHAFRPPGIARDRQKVFVPLKIGAEGHARSVRIETTPPIQEPLTVAICQGWDE